MEIETFKCLKCGNCCSTLVGTEKEDLGLRPPCFIGSQTNPVILLNKPTLNIADWEKDLFPEQYRVPNCAVFDLISKKVIILNYTLKVGCCPLLNQDKCLIYEKRPVACRSFPHPYYGLDSGGKPHDSFGFCKGEIPLNKLNEMMGVEKFEGKTRIRPAVLYKNLYKRYGEALVYQLIAEDTDKAITEGLNKLSSIGKIRLATKGYKLEGLANRMNNSADVSNLLEENGFGQLKSLASSENIDKIKAMLESL